jgi:hypothetical protein
MFVGDSLGHPMYSTLIEAYGVTISLVADDKKILEEVKSICSKAFVNRLAFTPIGSAKPDLHYTFLTSSKGDIEYDLDGALSGTLLPNGGSERHLNSMIRAHVAGKSKNWVFIHAGVVEWRGKAIIIPGQSYQGKTTLVSELIRIGAGYMSDEFAILDKAGLVHPFDRDLAVRTVGDMESIPPATFGAKRRLEPIEAGMVVFTSFVETGVWKPQQITAGRGILAAVPQVIPFSFNTEFALKVLNTTFNRAIIVKSDRGEARETAPKILAFFDESLAGAETLA